MKWKSKCNLYKNLDCWAILVASTIHKYILNWFFLVWLLCHRDSSYFWNMMMTSESIFGLLMIRRRYAHAVYIWLLPCKCWLHWFKSDWITCLESIEGTDWSSLVQIWNHIQLFQGTTSSLAWFRDSTGWPHAYSSAILSGSSPHRGIMIMKAALCLQ